MRVVVTGAAGFIGSTLVDALLAQGDDVVGIDCFTDYYAVDDKRANLAGAGAAAGFDLLELDLRVADPAELKAALVDADVVFHLAAQPGVRLSWSERFDDYVGHNLVATQRLLEAVVDAGGPRVVLASSSSVYGDVAAHPTAEDSPLAPHSPYGVTKLAAEHLARVYAANHGIDVVSLRYFTVYGPRQRPDMAIRRLLDATHGGPSFLLFGDGSAVRDFTFVDDVVAATLAAATHPAAPGTTCNVAGGEAASMTELLSLVAEVAGVAPVVERRSSERGDVTRTGGDIRLARDLLGWAPRTTLRDGVTRQWEWQCR